MDACTLNPRKNKPFSFSSRFVFGAPSNHIYRMVTVLCRSISANGERQNTAKKRTSSIAEVGRPACMKSGTSACVTSNGSDNVISAEWIPTKSVRKVRPAASSISLRIRCDNKTRCCSDISGALINDRQLSAKSSRCRTKARRLLIAPLFQFFGLASKRLPSNRRSNQVVLSTEILNRLEPGETSTPGCSLQFEKPSINSFNL